MGITQIITTMIIVVDTVIITLPDHHIRVKEDLVCLPSCLQVMEQVRI